MGYVAILLFKKHMFFEKISIINTKEEVNGV